MNFSSNLIFIAIRIECEWSVWCRAISLGSWRCQMARPSIRDRFVWAKNVFRLSGVCWQIQGFLLDVWSVFEPRKRLVHVSRDFIYETTDKTPFNLFLSTSLGKLPLNRRISWQLWHCIFFRSKFEAKENNFFLDLALRIYPHPTDKIELV